ncbi:MAG: hypothetical protein ASARMPRED_005100 [Alectoria sarmentosa]|nr:MAG: hypothetical protein ASARMPRED_005100 [Alectoria sarmentosa]
MAVSLAIFLLVPLSSVNAAPPAVQISNGEIQPVGTATACSTITTTIGTRIDHIPVPCSAFPPVFTEEVIVNGTSASLVIGPSGDVNFENEPWLAQPTSKNQTTTNSGIATSTGTSASLPIGSISSQSSGSQAANSTRTSAESSLSTQSRNLESLSSGSSGALLTASPASLTISIPSPTTASHALTSGPGGISPGFPSSAFVPIATPITSLDPIGPVVKSSASAVQSSISIIIPVIQSYIDKPTCDSCSTDAVNALKEVLPIIEDLSDSIGPGPSPHPCSASLNLLADIFNAVKCAAQNVENAISHIEGGEDDIGDLKSDVTNLNDLKKPLDNDDEDDDDESQSAPSQSQSNPTQSKSSASKASASQLSTMTSLTVSKVSLSASSSPSTTASSSSGSCALPPVVTLPPDSLTGPSQPDQPTSVIVTGLPTSATRTSNTLITGTVSVSGTVAGSAPATTTQTANITPAPTISCSLQNVDPDQGINTNYCVCSGSTFPVLSVEATATGPGASCAYTSLPSANTLHPTANLPVITSNCQVCSVGFDSEQCTALPNCTPTSAPASTAATTTTSAPPPPSSRK